MKVQEWNRILKLDNEDTFHKKLKVGTKFLYGTHMIGQIDKRLQPGAPINYYVVINKKENSVEYMQQFDTLK